MHVYGEARSTAVAAVHERPQRAIRGVVEDRNNELAARHAAVDKLGGSRGAEPVRARSDGHRHLKTVAETHKLGKEGMVGARHHANGHRPGPLQELHHPLVPLLEGERGAHRNAVVVEVVEAHIEARGAIGHSHPRPLAAYGRGGADAEGLEQLQAPPR